jgi:hypothetical protein
MRLSLKISEQTYGLVTRRMARHDEVDIWPRARTYGQSVTGKSYF